MAKNDYDEFLRELKIFLQKDEDILTLKESSECKKQPNSFKKVKDNLNTFNNNFFDKKDIEFNDIILDNSVRFKNLPLEDTPREKLFKRGVDNLLDYELLAILLGSGSKDEDVITLSKKLLKYILKFQRVSEITISDLLKIKGIGLSKASSIIAALEFFRRINFKKSIENFSINSPKSVADIFMNILKDELKEHFYVILLDTKNNIISWDEISKGDLNSSIVHPREVFKFALKFSTNSLICLHNHPSGDPSPSKEDIDITKRLYEVGNLVGIRVLDHIIIGFNKFISLKEYGVI